MSEQQAVFIRHAGWIEKCDVEVTNEQGDLVTALHPRMMIKAVCHTGGAADITKYKRNGDLVYQGFGTWNDTKIELPTGVQIRIARGKKIWIVDRDHKMIIDSSIRVYADVDEGEMEYVFRHNGVTCTIGIEDAELI